MYKVNRFGIYSFIIIALVIHITILNHISIWGAKPDLMLLIVIFCSLFFGAGAGVETGIACGLLKDLFALDYLGINTVIFASIGVFVGTMKAGFFKESKMTQFILVFVMTSVSMILHYLLVYCFAKNLSLTIKEYAMSSVAPTALYTSIFALPVFSKLCDMYNLKETEGLL